MEMPEYTYNGQSTYLRHHMPRVRGWLRTRRPHLAGTRHQNRGQRESIRSTSARPAPADRQPCTASTIPTVVQDRERHAAQSVDWDAATEVVAEALKE